MPPTSTTTGRGVVVGVRALPDPSCQSPRPECRTVRTLIAPTRVCGIPDTYAASGPPATPWRQHQQLHSPRAAATFAGTACTCGRPCPCMHPCPTYVALCDSPGPAPHPRLRSLFLLPGGLSMAILSPCPFRRLARIALVYGRRPMIGRDRHGRRAAGPYVAPTYCRAGLQADFGEPTPSSRRARAVSCAHDLGRAVILLRSAPPDRSTCLGLAESGPICSALASCDAPLIMAPAPSSPHHDPTRHLDHRSRVNRPSPSVNPRPWRACSLIPIASATTKCCEGNTQDSNSTEEANKGPTEKINEPTWDDHVYFPSVHDNSTHRDGAIYKNKRLQQEEYWFPDLADRTETQLEPVLEGVSREKGLGRSQTVLDRFGSPERNTLRAPNWAALEPCLSLKKKFEALSNLPQS
ncbi:hypothetical protein HU200_042811 [Digitaria exilis]|uniref:Uncharacterized protein n=1 Tax=Digitaria exilis TaxID=1010633 RepID=A0A835B689_9POAL|nr:hypothetical protein HU200_042811 [Digitaria exilis]